MHWELTNNHVRLLWRESGGPAVVAPTRRGFGSRLFENALARELGGSVSLNYDEVGVRCEIAFTLATQSVVAEDWSGRA